MKISYFANGQVLRLAKNNINHDRALVNMDINSILSGLQL